ncbi:unnamed protein product [Lupinus luteus]|uniref:Uncharacterized protein n=1 Tax=Lupinus luteus TaxID=3873 RepID=A0AAV1X0R0_LUPLU
MGLGDQLFGDNGTSNFDATLCSAAFNFMFWLLCHNKDSSDTNLGSEGTGLFDKWLLFQLVPLETLRMVDDVLS